MNENEKPREKKQSDLRAVAPCIFVDLVGTCVGYLIIWKTVEWDKLIRLKKFV